MSQSKNTRCTNCQTVNPGHASYCWLCKCDKLVPLAGEPGSMNEEETSHTAPENKSALHLLGEPDAFQSKSRVATKKPRFRPQKKRPLAPVIFLLVIVVPFVSVIYAPEVLIWFPILFVPIAGYYLMSGEEAYEGALTRIVSFVSICISLLSLASVAIFVAFFIVCLDTWTQNH